MARLKIFKYPDVVLAQKAKPVDRVEKKLWSFADDMLETMYVAPGIGLAANQVGDLRRIIVLDTHYERGEKGEPVPEDADGIEVSPTGILYNKKPMIMINPVIVSREGEIIYCEGCLSVPDYSAEVKRAEKIQVQYQDLDGLTKTLDAEGLQAICIQHEIDHLDGKLFIDRLSALKRDLARKKVIKWRREMQEAGEDEDQATAPSGEGSSGEGEFL